LQQTSHGYQQNMVYQIIVRLNTSPCVKAGQGGSAWGVGSQKPGKELKRYVQTEHYVYITNKSRKE
ncbi:hypothetical protein ACQP3F_33570, partial [Escherichia coli]